jgi:hypothetical protein
MPKQYHVRGCRYEGSAQPCDSASCREGLAQEVRVLLTDAYVLFASHPGQTEATWRKKYERLIEYLA